MDLSHSLRQLSAAPRMEADRAFSTLIPEAIMPDKTPQKFLWYELMTSDLSAAESFYKTVVGWTSEHFPGQDFPYIIVKAGERGSPAS